jgi:hypothetical protein
MQRTFGFAVLLVVCIATSVHAQRAPDHLTLDRGDGISRIGLDLGFTLVDDPAYDAALRLELFGQHVTRSGFGIYGALPIARSFGGGDAPAPEDATALGNLELGGLFVAEPSPDISWVFRVGVALPTADDDADGALTNSFATYPRLTDLALVVPDAAYVRLAVSPLIHMRTVFLRVDVGVDLGIDTGDAETAEHLARFNVGAGIDFDTFALGIELVNSVAFDEFSSGDQFVHALMLGARFMGESLQPFLGVGLPLDDSARERVTLFFSGGIQYVFH